MGRKAKVLISLLALIIIAGGTASSVWLRYVSNTFNPFIETLDTRVQDNTNHVRRADAGAGWRYLFPLFTYAKTPQPEAPETLYAVSVHRPGFLDFGGDVSLLSHTQAFLDEGPLFPAIITDHRVRLRFRPGSGEITLGLIEVNGIASDEISARVDRNGYLHNDSEITGERRQAWLDRHERFYASVMETFAYMRELFGEDVFD
jgi:hypothetical protein